MLLLTLEKDWNRRGALALGIGFVALFLGRIVCQCRDTSTTSHSKERDTEGRGDVKCTEKEDQ
jgi:hypothetical protein